MRILMACMKFPTEPGDSYMTNELAAALVAEGHQVEVLLVDWAAPPGSADGPVRDWNNVRVVQAAPRRIEGLGAIAGSASKFVLTGRNAAKVAARELELDCFDIFVAWAPLLAIAPLVRLVRRAAIPRRLLFIWDFFPDHHREIGRIPAGPAYWIARAWEQSLTRTFTNIVCTLPQNAEYLHRTLRLGQDQKVAVAPIWSHGSSVPCFSRSKVRARYGLPQDQPIAVFGGQLVEGRGFDLILAAAKLGLDRRSPLTFLFLGDGRLAPMIEERARTQANVIRLPALPRDDYLRLAAACDVGLVATVPGVTSFSIPSKTLDYLRAGLPMVVAIEPGNDFAALIEQYGVGRAVAFGDVSGFLDAAEDLTVGAGAGVAAAAQLCLDEVFHVRNAVAAVLGSA